MNLLLLTVFCCVLCVQGSPLINNDRLEFKDMPNRYLWVEGKDGNLEYIDLSNQTIEATAILSDVTYYLYTTENPEKPVKITSTDDYDILDSTNFNPQRKTVFIIHGWNTDSTGPMSVTLRTEMLKFYDLNIFIVDWSKMATWGYVTAHSAIPDISTFLSNYIIGLMQKYNIPFSNISTIGHSLGAHIAGVSARLVNNKLGSKLSHVVGLDPAFPLFTINYMGNRIAKKDAEFIQIIHTCTGFLGFSDPLGDADYYPNPQGGWTQPGCSWDLLGACSHARSYEYYAESLNKNQVFLSHQCDNDSMFLNGKCNNTPTSPMGTLDIDKTASGTYYLNTNANIPYAQTA